MLQTVDSNGRKYNPSRDIAQLYQRLVQISLDSLARDRWGPVMREFAAFSKLQDSDLIDAGVAMAKFVVAAKHPQNESFGAAYEDSGLHLVAPAALMAVMARLGAETTGAYYSAVREAYGVFQNAPGADYVQETADRLQHLSGKGPTAKLRLADQMTAFLTEAIQKEEKGQ